jgi:hypothetical protein
MRAGFCFLSVASALRCPAPRASVATALPAAEAARLFGRFADQVLYLDANVGACCHSACSDCEWRDAEGGYRFDLMKAVKPKWACCYLHRDFADERGSHTPRWVLPLFPDGAASAALSRAEFEERLQAVEFEMPMGPKGIIRAGEEALASETVELFWSWLADGSDTLDAQQAVQRLQDMSPDENREGAIGEGPDSVDWKTFARALGAAPFDRW